MADRYAQPGEYTPTEAMVIYAARFLKNFDGKKGLIGTGLPLVATQLAKKLYCPNMIIFVETGQYDANPPELPISIMDSRITYGSSWQMGDPEGLFPLSRDEIDFGFIGGAQIDKYGNVNSTFVGDDYNKPFKRLAGTAGAVDIGVFARTTVTLMAHQKRRVVEMVDYLTTPGWMVKKWPEGDLVRREELGLQGGPSAFVSTLGIMQFDDETKEMYVDKLFPGVSSAELQGNTGFAIDVSRATATDLVLVEEVRMLREEIDPLNIYRMR